MKYVFYPLIIIVLILQSCGPSRFVEPLKKRENAISASLGGPMVKVPGVATIPMPFTSLTYGRGITNNITVFGSWYSTAAIFGTLQFDAGATMRIIESKNGKHGMSATGGFNFATDRWEWNSKIWPQLDANYYWKYNHRYQQQDDLFEYRSDPETFKYLSVVPKDLKDIEKFIKKSSKDVNIQGTWFQFVVILKENQRLIGDIGLHFLESEPENKQVELGYTLNPNFRGKGYAQEALTEIIDYLFNSLHKHRIIASIDPNNASSIKLIEKLGFRKEAHFKKSLFFHGKWVDDLVYALLKEDWKSN